MWVSSMHRMHVAWNNISAYVWVLHAIVDSPTRLFMFPDTYSYSYHIEVFDISPASRPTLEVGATTYVSTNCAQCDHDLRCKNPNSPNRSRVCYACLLWRMFLVDVILDTVCLPVVTGIEAHISSCVEGVLA